MAKSDLLIPPPGKKVHLEEYDPGDIGKYKQEDEVAERLEKDLKHLQKLQDVLYADCSHSLLVILQAIDAGGKDGTINHVFRGVNPQGVNVFSFKQPTDEQLAHDFLWRVHPHVPAKGDISVFNRSYYEDVLVVRVHKLAEKKVWKARYDQINDFEALLTANGTTVLKFFLYISKEEQKKRFQARLDDPDKRWKFSTGDLDERALWDEYIEAYEDVLTKCNTESAPWHIIPANHKWYRNLVITQAIIDALEAMNLKYPEPVKDIHKITIPD
jgi:PPK2 family polyphosphate:nucleotide phosphotransferase